MTRGGASTSKRKSCEAKDSKSGRPSDERPDQEQEEPNSGFSNWLRSGDGVEYMKTFVMINSVIVFVTMTVPHLQKMFDVVKSYWDEYDN